LAPKNIMERTEKKWGFEQTIVNNKLHNYCFKELTVKANRSCSLHYHEKKNETFIIVRGCLKLEYIPSESFEFAEWRSQDPIDLLHKHGETITLFPGDQFVLPINTPHRFTGKTECTFFEISNYHDDKDVVRLIPS